MRIACIGNMNNIIAPAAQYLAVEGHEVDLFLLYEYDHFSPEADYNDPSEIKFKIKNLEMDFGGVMEVPKSTIKNSLGNYDFYIGTDYAPALLARIGKRLDLFAWAGTDLFDWPFYKSHFRIPQKWEAVKIMTALLQRIGIQESYAIPMSLNNDFILDALGKSGFKGKIVEPLPFLYYPNLSKALATKSRHKDEAEKIRAENDLVLVQQSRQWWKTAPAHISKGNDVFFYGLKKFKERNPHVKFKAILFEYGGDVQASKELLKELGLEEHVAWFPKMLRKELLSVLATADIGVGQFGSESWYLYCSNVEIIASGAAYLGYRNDGYYAEKKCELYPMLNANSEDEVANKIAAYLKNRENEKERKTAALNWLLDYNEVAFQKNIKEELGLSKNRKRSISFASRWSIFWKATQCRLIVVLNNIVLATRSKMMVSRILEWKNA